MQLWHKGYFKPKAIDKKQTRNEHSALLLFFSFNFFSLILLKAQHKFLSWRCPRAHFPCPERDDNLITEVRWCWGGVTRALLANPSCHQFPLHSPSHNRSPLEAQSPFPVSSHFYTKLFLCTSPSSNHPSEFFITEYSLVLISHRFSSVHPSFDNLNGSTLVNETNTGRGKHFFLPSSSPARWKSIQYSINRWDTELRALHCWESLFLIFLHYLAKVTLSSCLPWHYSKTNLKYAGWNPSHEYGTQDLHLPGHPSTTIYIKSRGHTFSCSLLHSTTDSQSYPRRHFSLEISRPWDSRTWRRWWRNREGLYKQKNQKGKEFQIHHLCQGEFPEALASEIPQNKMIL